MEYKAILDPIIVEPKVKADACVIWMHGLGANGNDFESIVDYLGLPNNHGIRFIFPNAPTRAVTLNAGIEMPAWYDIYSLDKQEKEDEKGISESSNLINDLIQDQINKGISSNKIILAGYSQGGALALYTGLRLDKKLGGIIALSCYMPIATKLEKERNPANFGTSIFQAHGMLDAVVLYQYGKLSKNRLIELGYDVEWHSYQMQHEVISEEIIAIGKFILNVYQNSNKS